VHCVPWHQSYEIRGCAASDYDEGIAHLSPE
jgi:hypothetical protein